MDLVGPVNPLSLSPVSRWSAVLCQLIIVVRSRMSSLLDDEAFKGKEAVDRRKIEEFRIKGLQEVAADLKEYESWDGVAKVGCVAVRIDRQGTITQDMVHLLGFTEPKRLDARLIFGKDYQPEGHQVQLDKVDLSTFRFRGGLRSAFLGSSEFSWSIWRPSTEKPGVWREVEIATAIKDGARPLFMAAVVQPWTNLRFLY